ncbi:MAG: hypothetical protein ABJO67_08440 [Pseudoruegeria sp.]
MEDFLETTNEVKDAEMYFYKTPVGVWSAKLPFGKNYELYFDDPIVRRFLGSAFGMPPLAFYLSFSILTALSWSVGALVPEYIGFRYVMVFFLGSISWLHVGVLEAAFVQIDAGAEEGKIKKPSAALKEYLKITTRRLAWFANLMSVSLIAVTSTVWGITKC